MTVGAQDRLPGVREMIYPYFFHKLPRHYEHLGFIVMGIAVFQRLACKLRQAMARENSPRNRQRAQLERKKNKRASYDRILIICEGAKTEPLYFDEIRQFYKLHTANIQVMQSAYPRERNTSFPSFWPFNMRRSKLCKAQQSRPSGGPVLD